jgi:hypothetical protein
MSQQNKETELNPGMGNLKGLPDSGLQSYLDFIDKCIDLMEQGGGVEYFSQNIKELKLMKHSVLHELTERSILS